MKSDTIYRVKVKTTQSLQPDRSTSWQTKVLYCGTDRTAARIEFHRSNDLDYSGGYGNPRCRTIFEVIEDGATDDAADDVVTAVDREDV
jgi:hypothetical protein